MLMFLLTSEPQRTPDDLIDSYIAQIAAGDTDALGSLYHQTKASVYSYALSILKSPHDAEDVLQDCFVAVNSSAGGYVSAGKPMAWILTITKNLCLKILLERKRNSGEPDENDLALSGLSRDLSTDDRLIVEECLDNLSDTERQIVVLHVVSGFKHREIAAFMSLPLSTVLSRYNRAIAKLRKNLVRGEGQ